jgi:hypothetical protein
MAPAGKGLAELKTASRASREGRLRVPGAPTSLPGSLVMGRKNVKKDARLHMVRQQVRAC